MTFCLAAGHWQARQSIPVLGTAADMYEHCPTCYNADRKGIEQWKNHTLSMAFM